MRLEVETGGVRSRSTISGNSCCCANKHCHTACMQSRCANKLCNTGYMHSRCANSHGHVRSVRACGVYGVCVCGVYIMVCGGVYIMVCAGAGATRRHYIPL